MPSELRDLPLPISPAAVIGDEWMNDTPWVMQSGSILRSTTRWTITADGQAKVRSDGVIEADGKPVKPGRITLDYAGTWAIVNEQFILDVRRLSSWPNEHKPLEHTLVERHGSDGLVRVVLRGPSGGVMWRVPTT